MQNSQWKTIKEALLTIFHIVLDWILEFALGKYLGPKRKVIPFKNEDQEILAKSAVELGRLIKLRKITSYQLVKLYIERIKDVNPQLNAIVDGPFEEALQEAKKVDQQLDDKLLRNEELEKRPFFGVPFTTKDSTAVGGKLQTLGLVSRKNARAAEDAECVRKMRESGAIILATTNIPEVNRWIESRNAVIGQTNNPYDLRRSVGGSSGGEACLISACCTGFGLGTDIGGSIRIPAFNCGVFGHKPTVNAINTKGCTFREGTELTSMVVAGPMARYASDLLPLFKTLVSPEKKQLLLLDSPVDVKKLKYYYIPENNMKLCNPMGNDQKDMMNRICKHFEKVSGRKVELAKLPNLHLTGKMWRYWMSQEPAKFDLLLGNGNKLNPYVEIIKKFVGQSDFTMASIFSLIDSLLPKEKEHFIRAATEELENEFQKLLGNDGVLFYHSAPRTAPFHFYPLVKFNDFHYFSLFNVLHAPSTQVPMGLTEQGMPLGVQVVATKNNDRLCLAVAEELEREFGGWKRPFNE